ncbi:MAG: maleylpyruvate isomerase family mycothiol-dependent enzyme [Ornithinimicrobium sp.]
MSDYDNSLGPLRHTVAVMEEHRLTPPQPRTDVAADYTATAKALTDVVAGAGPAEWAARSPCEGWSASDVLTHLIVTQRDFFAEHDLALNPLTDSEHPAQRWDAHVTDAVAVLQDPVVTGRVFDGFFGPTTIGATIQQFYVWDMVVHRWDLARAMERDAALSEQELDRVEASIPLFGEALYMPGICAAAVHVAQGEPRLVRVMARLGRDAQGESES